MHKIVPVIGLSGYFALHSFAGGGNAISSEAVAARAAAGKVVSLAERSDALFGHKAAALSELATLTFQHSRPGWDGEDAKPIHPQAARLARLFVRAIPDSLPLPEFSADPDGAVSLDWATGRDHALSISVFDNDRLAYAWLDGTSRGHGAVLFDGKQIPPRILQELGVISQSDADFRAA